MAIPAVPLYLGQTFNDTPPGHRFMLYGAFWEPESWQRIKNIAPAELKRDFGQLTPQNQQLRDALCARQACVAATLDQTIWSIEASSIAPFVTGTGIEHPLENGMAFLNPYGLPYLPGSSVKGVLRRAAEELLDDVFGEGTQGWDQSAIDALFGKELESGDSETDHSRGALTFWDVFPKCDRLAVDIMNPHYGDYYQGNTPPTDCGQPIPIFFLTVPENSGFAFHVQCDCAHLPSDWPEDRWRALLEAAFVHAFEWLGFGAKTAVGYGQFPSNAFEEAKAEREAAAQRRQEAVEKERAESERQKKLAAMSPLDREIEEIVIAAPQDQPRYKAILNALKQGRWSGDEARQAAEHICALMTQAGVWRTKSEKKKPEKDAPYQATLAVLAYLEGKK